MHITFVSALPLSLSVAAIQDTMVIIAGLIAAAAAAGVFTYVPAALGFTSAGIAAGTAAASMMSASAVASGGGVVAGGVVATLQSVGAAGIGATGYAAATAVGAAVELL